MLKIRHRITVIILVFAVSMGISYATLSEAVQNLNNCVAHGKLTLRSAVDAWQLYPGQYAQTTRTLYAGVKYTLIASGDQYATDVDIEVFDQNWNLIASDNRTAMDAAVIVQPVWTGSFYIRPKLRQSSDNESAWVSFGFCY